MKHVSSPKAPIGRDPRGSATLLRLALVAAICLASTPEGALAGRDPAPPVRACAEWEPAAGTLIRWPLGIPGSLVAELAEDDSLYVLVETAGQEAQARSTFGSYGVDLAHVRFIYANTYSHWTRDWGPLCVFDGAGEWGITDAVFNGYPWVNGCDYAAFRDEETHPAVPADRDRHDGATGAAPAADRGYYDEDNLVNGVLAAEFACPLHALPAFCTGGNIMVDGHGSAFSTRQMLSENAPELDEAEFRALAEEFLGVGDYHFVDKPEIHGIQHIDCYAKLLDEETILVKQVAPGHPEYACIEHLVDELSALASCYGRPYRIVRVFCGAYSGSSTAAYTNSLILNRQVLVPLFNIASDAGALATYAEAMPGYEVIGFPSGAWYYYDALHCRTMGIFDRHMLRLWHRPLDAEVPWAPAHEILALIDDRSETGLIADSLRVRWRLAGETAWQAAPLAALAAPDSFRALLPGAPPGETIEYFLVAADHSGRRETLPRTAPAGFYRFEVTGDPAATDERAPAIAGLALALGPNPGSGELWVRVVAPGGLPVAVEVLDPAGRLVRRLAPERAGTGLLEARWDGRDEGGTLCPGGAYWVRARCGAEQRLGGLIRLR